MSKTKKLAAAGVAAAFVCSAALAGCSSSTSSTSSNSNSNSNIVQEVSNTVSDKINEVKEENSNTTGEEKMAGGWSVPDEKAANLLTEEQQAVFDKAEFDVAYSPVSLLATQVVAGTNYAFLCQKPALSPSMSMQWYVVVLYEDLDGKVEVTMESGIDPSDVAVMKEAGPEAVGAWETVSAKTAATLPEGAQAAFEEALPASDDVSLTPLALLGQQVVAGENYRVLCVGKTVKGAKSDELFVAEIYQPLTGSAELTSLSLFDLVHYVEAGGGRDAAETIGEIATAGSKIGEAAVSEASATISGALNAVKNANDNENANVEGNTENVKGDNNKNQ